MLTHAYSGAPNIAGAFTNIVQDGKLLPAALEAKRRGVIFDVGHGGGSFDYTVVRGRDAAGRAARHDLVRHPRVLRQLARHAVSHLGDEQVPGARLLARAGDHHGDRPRPRKVINRMPKLGTLQVGAPGDVAIMELVEGPVSFVDTRNNRREGKALSQAGADRDRRRAVRPAVQFAVRGEVTRIAHARARRACTAPSFSGSQLVRCRMTAERL